MFYLGSFEKQNAEISYKKKFWSFTEPEAMTVSDMEMTQIIYYFPL